MPKKLKKSPVSLDNLANMVQKGFVEAQEDRDKRFSEVNRRLDRIEKKILDNHEKRIKRLEEALSL